MCIFIFTLATDNSIVLLPIITFYNKMNPYINHQNNINIITYQNRNFYKNPSTVYHQYLYCERLQIVLIYLIMIKYLNVGHLIMHTFFFISMVLNMLLKLHNLVLKKVQKYFTDVARKVALLGVSQVPNYIICTKSYYLI